MAISDVQPKNENILGINYKKVNGITPVDCSNSRSFLMDSIKESLTEIPSDLIPYADVIANKHKADVFPILNDYAFYYGILSIYEEQIASNIGKTIVNKKLNKIFSADVSIMVSEQKNPLIDNGLKSVVKDSLISGSSLLIVKEDSNDFMSCKFESIPAYRYYKDHKLLEDGSGYIDTFSVYTIVGRDMFRQVRVYDSIENVTTITEYKLTRQFSEKVISEESFDGILQYEFNNIDTYSDINNVKELILGFDLSLTNIYKNTKTALPKLHVDREFESAVLNDEDLTIVYDVPSREDGQAFYNFEASDFVGNELWESASKILSLICSTTGLSEEILGFENLAEVKSTTTVYEDDKTAETINALKTHYAYIINSFLKLYKSGTTITLGIYNKQSLELRSKTANTLMASVIDKMKYIFPEASYDELMTMVCRYKNENNIVLNNDEEEFNNKNNIFTPVVEEVVDTTDNTETIKKQNANARKKSTANNRILDN